MIHNNVYLQSLSYELPKHILTTDEIYKQLSPTFERLGIPGSWVRALSGVDERRIWDEGETLTDAAARVAKKALDESGVPAEDIGCVIGTSVSKEFIEPSMACMVHSALELPASTISYDISNACLAFINGISYMGQLIDNGIIKAALLVDVENSRFVVENTIKKLLEPGINIADFSKRFAGLTLGSGAVAAVVTGKELAGSRSHKVAGQVSMADTRYCRYCVGTFSDIAAEQTNLMKAGVALAKRTWDSAAESMGWTADTFDHFICHQIGARHEKLLFDTLGLDAGKAFQTFPFLGNIGPASAPITMAMAAERGVIRAGEKVGILGIGSGLNCSMMEVVW